MELLKILAEMHEERKRLKTIIAGLVAMQGTPAKSRVRRVPKGMAAEARKAASQRMRKYWEARKQRESEAAK
jgi:hypothetical protein